MQPDYLPPQIAWQSTSPPLVQSYSCHSLPAHGSCSPPTTVLSTLSSHFQPPFSQSVFRAPSCLHTLSELAQAASPFGLQLQVHDVQQLMHLPNRLVSPLHPQALYSVRLGFLQTLHQRC